MEELIKFANMFLVTNGLFFAALGATETHNDKLKVGLSVAGGLVSGFWLLCTTDINLLSPLSNREWVLQWYLPLAFIVGWLVSLGIHAWNWRQDVVKGYTWLFSYGTLQQKNVQLANFGRELDGNKDTLCGYQVGEISITDERVLRESGKDIHPILRYTGNDNDQVEGMAFRISKAELLRADDYEVDDYVRREATLRSGKRCWIYAAVNN